MKFLSLILSLLIIGYLVSTYIKPGVAVDENPRETVKQQSQQAIGTARQSVEELNLRIKEKEN